MPLLKCLPEVGMVPEVEELGSELEIAAPRFAEHEVLEEGNVPVLTSRATDGVSRRVAPGAGSRVRIDRGIGPFGNRMGIMHRARLVRTVQVLTVVWNDVRYVVVGSRRC